MDTSTEQIAPAGAELVKASLNMGAGELEVGPGSQSLVDASFHYSRNLGRPIARYRVEDRVGILRVEGPDSEGIITTHRFNEWFLKFSDRMPIEFDVHLGAGESRLDLARLLVRRLSVRVGAGRMTLTLGHADQNVDVDIAGGVGDAIIKLPAGQSIVASATGGIGSIDTRNLQRRDGRYYSESFSPDKPTIEIRARGGVGSIRMEVEG